MWYCGVLSFDARGFEKKCIKMVSYFIVHFTRVPFFAFLILD